MRELIKISYLSPFPVAAGGLAHSPTEQAGKIVGVLVSQAGRDLLHRQRRALKQAAGQLHFPVQEIGVGRDAVGALEQLAGVIRRAKDLPCQFGN